MLISSRSNERVKEARSLRESKFRRATGLHFIEGDKLVGEALTSGAEVTTVFCREGTSAPRGGFELLEVTEGVMEALCTGTPQNLCALVRTPVTAPPEEYRGLIVVLEQLQDPGNVGTILRTADALGGGRCAAFCGFGGSLCPQDPSGFHGFSISFAGLYRECARRT